MASSSSQPAGETDPSRVRNVGPGAGDYVKETRFKYVGQGPEPGLDDKKNGCSRAATCFGAFGGGSRSSGEARNRTLMTVTPAGAGGGEYVQETAFKYVGAGVGDFALVSDPPGPEAEDCASQLGSITYESLRRSLESTWMFRLAALAIVFLLALIITWALWPTTGDVGPRDVPDKDVSREQCLKDAIAAALSDGEISAPHESFQVTLDHSNFARFGFLLEPEHGALFVAGVDGGLLANWNEDHPHKTVRNGDYVVEVNGISDSTRDMLREFNKPSVVHMTALRIHCGDEDSRKTALTSRSPSGSTAWECYGWTEQEKAMLQSWSANEEQMCTTDRNDGYEYVYTHGDELVAEGCGRCWCCRRHTDGADEHDRRRVISLLFRPGLKGYEGFTTAELRADTRANDANVLEVDADEHGSRTNVLLRFGGIIGNRADQVHPKSQIRSAALNINIINPGQGIEVHKMRKEWDSATVYQELGGDGVTPGQEADSEVLASAEMVEMGLLSLDVTKAVQAWADGDPNNGIVLLPKGGDGVSFMASGTPPALTVEVLQEPGVVTTLSTSGTTAHPTTSTTVRSAMVTTAAPMITTTPDPHGLHAEFFFSVDPQKKTFEAATWNKQPDVVQQVPDVNYYSGSPRWDPVAVHTPIAARWSGELSVQKGGIYTFQVLTDNSATLSIDGKVLLADRKLREGEPLWLASRATVEVNLTAGGHEVVVALLVRSENLLAVGLMYTGPDTDGKRVPVPKAAFMPRDSSVKLTDTAAQVAYAMTHVRLERKFSTRGRTQPVHGRAVELGAGVVVLAGALIALAPSLQAAFEPVRRAWRARAQRRQLRRYDALAGLIEGPPTHAELA